MTYKRLLKGNTMSDQTCETIDNMIDQCAAEAEGYHAADPEYTKIVNNIKTLSESKPKPAISKELIVRSLVELAGLLLVLQHERVGVITSKAFTMLRRL